MDYTLSNSYDTDAGTGLRMHEDAKAIPTVWSGKDANSLIWSVMEVVKAAGLAGIQFDKANAASYRLLLKALRSNGLIRGVDTGVANALVVALTPALDARVDGMVLWVKAKATNTAATTLNDGLGAVPVVGAAHTPLQAGEIVADGACQFVWSATLGVWVLVECTGGALQVGRAIQSQHAAQLAQLHSAYATRGLVAGNNAITPTTKYDAAADIVVLRNPTTGALAVSSSVAAITNDTAVAGPSANGRDQAAVLTASSWVHFYFIWNGATLATLSSASAPPIGPTLPAGYTHWCYIGAVYYTGSSQLQKVRLRGNAAFYESAQSALAGAGNTTETLVSVATLVPPNALDFTLHVNMGLASNGSSAQTGSNLYIRALSGSDLLSITVSVAAASQTAWNTCPVRVPNILQRFYFMFGNETNPGNILARQNFTSVVGYTLPNGGV